MFGQHRQTARKERTCLLIMCMSGANRFIGIYRVISGRERKRTQVIRDFSRGTSAIFVNVPRCIMFYRLFIGNLTHTKDPRQTHDASGGGGGRVSSFAHRLSSGMFWSTTGLIRPEIGVSEYTPDGLPFIGSQSGLNRDYIGSYYQYLVTSGVFRDKNR